MNDFTEFLKFLGVFVVTGILLFALPSYAVDRLQCSGFGSATGMETKYAGFHCYVKTDKGFVPKEYVFGEAVEARIKKLEDAQ